MKSHTLAKRLLKLPNQTITYQGAVGDSEGYTMKLSKMPGGELILHQVLTRKRKKAYEKWLSENTVTEWVPVMTNQERADMVKEWGPKLLEAAKKLDLK